MKTILIVDDELANSEVLALILEDEGYRVVCASNGRQGLERVAEKRPDLVILDFMMPVMSGDEMGRALRADKDNRAVKIMISSSLAEAAVQDRFDEYDAFLRKPYRIDQALQVIADLLKTTAK